MRTSPSSTPIARRWTRQPAPTMATPWPRPMRSSTGGSSSWPATGRSTRPGRHSSPTPGRTSACSSPVPIRRGRPICTTRSSRRFGAATARRSHGRSRAISTRRARTWPGAGPTRARPRWTGPSDAMRAFAFEQPESLRDAIAVLARAPEARLLAGGTDLIIRLRDGSVATDVVVDVKRIHELDASISEGRGGLMIGARTVMTDIAADPRIRGGYAALAEGAAVVGSAQIRNRATLAGNICNASPAADTVPALLVFGATVVVTGPGGERRIPIDEV